MVATYTASNGFIKEGTGDNTNTWGSVLNSQMIDLVDEALDGVFAVTITGNAAVTLTIVNGTASVASTGATQQVGRPSVLLIQGVRSTTHAITTPQRSKWWIVIDQTTGAGTVTMNSGAGGTTATVVQGRRTLVFCDGTGVYNMASTEPRLDQIDAPTAAVAMNGQRITGGAAAVALTDFVTRSNTLDQLAVPAANVGFGGFRLTNLGAPTTGSDAATRTYVDTAIATAGLPSTAGTILIDGADTTAGYSGAKLTVASGLTATVVNPGGNETLRFGPDLAVLQAAITMTTTTVPAGAEPSLGLNANPALVERAVRRARIAASLF